MFQTEKQTSLLHAESIRRILHTAHLEPIGVRTETQLDKAFISDMFK